MPDFPELEPYDDYNQQLEAQVRPRNWMHPTPQSRYHLVVIGAGTAGLVTAAGAAGLGAKVALVEQKLMGGDCLNVGCVPSKALIAAAKRIHEVRCADSLGVRVSGDVQADFSAIMQRMRKLRAQISPADSAQRFAKLGVDVYFGSACFIDSSHVDVDGTRLEYRKAVIATGARASAPPIPGIDDVEYLTNETVFSLTKLPPRLGVIGAGPIGVEMAQTFARLGSQVSLFEAAHGILPRDDRDAAAVVQRSLESDGVNLYCCGKSLKVAKNGGDVKLSGNSHKGEFGVDVDHLLVAAGRAPNVNGLDLEKVGVQYDESTGVEVNDRLQTTNPRIYAAGDVCGKYQFTHAADFYARTAIQNALFMGRKTASALNIPRCTYSDPELAQVGLNEVTAQNKNIAVDVFRIDFSDVDRAVLESRDDGFVKLLVAKGSDKLLGATIVGPHAGDMISQVTLAMNGGLGLGTMASSIHPYPTYAEAIRKAADAYNRTRLTPRVKWLLEKWLSWTS